MIEKDFIAFLKANTDLNALLGTRIYPSVLPQSNQNSAMVYHCRKYPKLGYSGNGRTNVHFQLDVYSTSYTEVKGIEEVLINVLQGFGGDIGTYVIQAKIENSFDSFEATTSLHRVTLDVSLLT